MTAHQSSDDRVKPSVEDDEAGGFVSVEDLDRGGRTDVEAGTGGPGERPLRPEAAAERANGIDNATAGDGVQFFEGEGASTGGTGPADVERGA